MTDDDDTERSDRVESLLDRQADTIDRQERVLREQRETIESLERRLEDGRTGVGDLSVSRRSALKAGGLLGVLGVGVGTVSADSEPQGQVGTAEAPLEALYTNTIDGPLTDNQSVESLVGNGLTVEDGTLGLEYHREAPASLGAVHDAMDQDDDGTYVVTDDHELQAMNHDPGGDYRLGNDVIALGTVYWNGGSGFDPIGDSSTPFTGSFDGNGHTILGLYIDRDGEDEVGLFGQTGPKATLADVALGNVTVIGSERVGGLVGLNDGNVEQSSATGSVSGSGRVGGLVGVNVATVQESSATGSVSGADFVGGLVGENDGTVERSSATGSVRSSNRAGGLVGENDGTVERSSATGMVTGSDFVGGLVGVNFATVQESSATGSVSGSGQVGGLVGINVPAQSTIIRESSATGSVSGAEDVGGLVGQNGRTVEQSYATGSVSGSGQVGGLVGFNDEGTVEQSYAAGSVENSRDVGGLVGFNDGGVVNTSYWDVPATGQDSSGGTGTGIGSLDDTPPADGLSGTDLNDSLESDFDFETVWATVPAGGPDNPDADDTDQDDYPVLQALDRQAQLEARR